MGNDVAAPSPLKRRPSRPVPLNQNDAAPIPLQLKRLSGRPVPPDQFANNRQKVSVNALLGMGLWFLLWLGYNTDLDP